MMDLRVELSMEAETPGQQLGKSAGLWLHPGAGEKLPKVWLLSTGNWVRLGPSGRLIDLARSGSWLWKSDSLDRWASEYLP